MSSGHGQSVVGSMGASSSCTIDASGPGQLVIGSIGAVQSVHLALYNRLLGLQEPPLLALLMLNLTMTSLRHTVPDNADYPCHMPAGV